MGEQDEDYVEGATPTCLLHVHERMTEIVRKKVEGGSNLDA